MIFEDFASFCRWVGGFESNLVTQCAGQVFPQCCSVTIPVSAARL